MTGGQGHSFIKLIWASNNCDAPPRRSERTRSRATVLNRLCRIKAEHHGSAEERDPSVKSEGRRRRVLVVRVNAVSMSHVEILHVEQRAWDLLLLPVAVLNIFPFHLQDSPLILQSDRNVTVNARNDQGQLTGQLTVGKTNTRYANAAVYDCSMLPWLQILSIKSKLDHFIPDMG